MTLNEVRGHSLSTNTMIRSMEEAGHEFADENILHAPGSDMVLILCRRCRNHAELWLSGGAFIPTGRLRGACVPKEET